MDLVDDEGIRHFRPLDLIRDSLGPLLKRSRVLCTTSKRCNVNRGDTVRQVGRSVPWTNSGATPPTTAVFPRPGSTMWPLNFLVAHLEVSMAGIASWSTVHRVHLQVRRYRSRVRPYVNSASHRSSASLPVVRPVHSLTQRRQTPTCPSLNKERLNKTILVYKLDRVVFPNTLFLFRLFS